MAEIRDHIPLASSSDTFNVVIDFCNISHTNVAISFCFGYIAWNNTREDIIVMFPICSSYMGGVIMLI